MTLPEHPECVQTLLAELEADTQRVYETLGEIASADAGRQFTLDWLVYGAVKRQASMTAAFAGVVRAWNMDVARALLRMHIDTALRFSAAWHVADPDDFARRVLAGERIDRMLDRERQPLTDKRLVQIHSAAEPWLVQTYAHLSGYVHFSASHIISTVQSLSEGPDGERRIRGRISPHDLGYPESSWLEVLRCFRWASGLLQSYLLGWATTKSLSAEQLEALRPRG